MDRKLDKEKPYATLYGTDPNLPKGPKGQLARYQQNNMYFDQFGDYVAGEYKAADAKDFQRDLEAENARLRAELEQMKGGKQEEKQEETELNREKIIEQLKERSVKFDQRSTTQKLYDLLQSAIDDE